MTDMITNMAAAYMNIGVTGLIIVVLLVLLVWWFTKGRKLSEGSRIRLAEELAKNGKIIENNTAVINNNSKVIEANTLQRADEKRCLEALIDRMTRHGEQHDEMLKNQAVAMEINRQQHRQ